MAKMTLKEFKAQHFIPDVDVGYLSGLTFSDRLNDQLLAPIWIKSYRLLRQSKNMKTNFHKFACLDFV